MNPQSSGLGEEGRGRGEAVPVPGCGLRVAGLSFFFAEGRRGIGRRDQFPSRFRVFVPGEEGEREAVAVLVPGFGATTGPGTGEVPGSVLVPVPWGSQCCVDGPAYIHAACIPNTMGV